jgi:tetratricopeptide (TPR) repeat protein
MSSMFGIGARGLHRPAGAGILVVLLVIGGAACSGQSDADLAREALEAGLAAQQAGDLENAQAQYLKCIEYEPMNKVCLYDLGLVSQTAGSRVAAENYYRLALAADPDYTPALFNLAIVSDQLGAPQEAIILYRRYVQLLPNDPRGHQNLGELLLRTGYLEEGYAELATAMALDPSLNLKTPPPSTEPTPEPSTEPTPEPTLEPTPEPSPSEEA